MDTFSQGFFSGCYVRDVYRRIKTMDRKNAFQIEAYLRCGLLNTHDLLFSPQQPIESIVRDYGDDASELLRCFLLRFECATSVKRRPHVSRVFAAKIQSRPSYHSRFHTDAFCVTILLLLPHAFFPRGRMPPNRIASFDTTRSMIPLGRPLRICRISRRGHARIPLGWRRRWGLVPPSPRRRNPPRWLRTWWARVRVPCILDD